MHGVISRLDANSCDKRVVSFPDLCHLSYFATPRLDLEYSAVLTFIWYLLSIRNWYTCIWASAWNFQQCCMCDQQSLRSACTYAQSDQSLCSSLEYMYSMIVKLLTEHHLECLGLKGGCRGSSESTHVKMPHCWKSHALAHLQALDNINSSSAWCVKFYCTRSKGT